MRSNAAVLFALALSLALSAPLASQAGYTLTILHTNDVNAEHLPGSDGYGGAARLATVVRQIRAEVANSLLLDAGNHFTGTLFHIEWQGQDSAQLMNATGYDAMALGGHEFDDGDELLAAFIDALEFPVLTANVDFAYSPALTGRVDPWVIMDLGGEPVGIIGLLTTTPAMISAPGASPPVERDLVSVTQAAVAALSAQGVNKVILLTSIGLEAAISLAPQLHGVDVILSSQSSDFLSNRYVGAQGAYPLVFEGAGGEPVLVAKVGEHARFLGRLDVAFDGDGVLTDWVGDDILLSRYIPPAPDVAALVATLEGALAATEERVLGETTVALQGGPEFCGVEECALGNLITDALRAHTGAQIAYINSNGFAGDIAVGSITLGDLLVVHPYNDIIETFQLSGKDFLATLEQAFAKFSLNAQGQVQRSGVGFLQLSGARIQVDPTREVGSRILRVELLDEAGAWARLDPESTYTLAGNDFVRKGGAGHTILAEKAMDPQPVRYADYAITMNYIAANSPVAPAVTGRITYVNAEVEPHDAG